MTQAERNTLLSENLHLAKAAAKYHAGRAFGDVHWRELFGVTWEGLREASTRWDPGRGVTFEWYAIRIMRGRVRDCFRRQDRLSRNARERVNKIQRLRAEGFSREVIAGQLGCRQFSRLWQLAGVPVSVPLGETDPAGEELPPWGRIEFADLLQPLPARDQRLMRLRYADGLNMMDTGAVLGISESRVCQLHARSLEKLRDLLSRGKLD